MRNRASRILISALLAVVGVAHAQGRDGRGLQVIVTPDHTDWKYLPGENVTFSIRVVQNNERLTGVKLSWKVGPEWSEDGKPLSSGTLTTTDQDARIDAGTLKEPGFLRMIATVSPDPNAQPAATPSRAVGTAAFSPEKIKPAAVEPPDFDAFWQRGKDALAAIPMDAQRTPYGPKTTDAINAYLVSFQTVKGAGGGGSSRFYGILAEPKKEGKYPAMLRLPGAGVYGVGTIWQESHENAIVLSVGIHGIPLDLDNSFYSNLRAGALDDYSGFNLDNKDLYYYRRVYLSMVRAVDYLTSLPNWDGKTVVVKGDSQGGALSIITAALDPRVKALAAFHPALSDMSGYAHGRVGGWPHIFRNPINRTKDKLDTAGYYDVVNFAKRVRVPGIYSWGYNDESCMPTTTYSAYNSVSAEKTLTLQLATGHSIAPAQKARVNAWVQEFFKTGIAPAPKEEAIADR